MLDFTDIYGVDADAAGRVERSRDIAEAFGRKRSAVNLPRLDDHVDLSRAGYTLAPAVSSKTISTQ